MHIHNASMILYIKQFGRHAPIQADLDCSWSSACQKGAGTHAASNCTITLNFKEFSKETFHEAEVTSIIFAFAVSP